MVNSTHYDLDQYVADLRRITSDTDDEDVIIRQVSPLAVRVATEKAWLEPGHYGTDPEQGFGVHVLHEEPDHSLAVIAVAWLPGRGTPPHDHGTWAVVAGVDGIERNIRYQRVDDRSRPDHARLEVKHDFNADAGDLVCMKTGGIHAVHNETSGVTLSLHTYGRHVNHTNRSQFDLETGVMQSLIVKLE